MPCRTALAKLASVQEVTTPGATAHGQFGEDELLDQIFGGLSHGYCAEIGAYDGVTGSASYRFEQRGWQCLLVEPIPALFEQIKAHRRCLAVNCAVSAQEGEATFFIAESFEQISGLDMTAEQRDWIGGEGGAVQEITVRTATLDSLLEEAGFPELQFVTIDVEGHEADVLSGFTLERHRPRILIVEDNTVEGNKLVAAHLTSRGYVHFRRTGVNEWYAHESDAELVRPDAVRRLAREVARERWARRRRHYTHRVAAAVGSRLPASVTRPLRAPFDALRRRAVNRD